MKLVATVAFLVLLFACAQPSSRENASKAAKPSDVCQNGASSLNATYGPYQFPPMCRDATKP